MSERPTLLFYCQHSLGLGHLVRSFALCTSLSERFRVVLVSGGVVPESLTPPAGVEIVALPPLGMQTNGKLVSRDGRWTVEEAQALRRRTLLETLDATHPQIIVVELFPFGRRKFTGELLPLLEAARAMPERPLLVSSLRDILVARDDGGAFDDRACELANRLFDAILIHSDPRIARLEESFHPRTPLSVPAYYTGFVMPERSAAPLPVAARREEIVVSAGGGLVGAPLLRAALAAQSMLWPQTRLRMKLVAGPFLPEHEWRSLALQARNQEGAELLRSVPDLSAELCGARASVSQCGYNTALDLLSSGVPALVVPFAEEGHDEQTNRARRLEREGALLLHESDHLDRRALAGAVLKLLRFRPSRVSLELDGARASGRLLAQLVGAPRSGRPVAPEVAA